VGKLLITSGLVCVCVCLQSPLITREKQDVLSLSCSVAHPSLPPSPCVLRVCSFVFHGHALPGRTCEVPSSFNAENPRSMWPSHTHTHMHTHTPTPWIHRCPAKGFSVIKAGLLLVQVLKRCVCVFKTLLANPPATRSNAIFILLHIFHIRCIIFVFFFSRVVRRRHVKSRCRYAVFRHRDAVRQEAGDC